MGFGRGLCNVLGKWSWRRKARSAKKYYWSISSPFNLVLDDATVRITMPPDEPGTVMVADLETDVVLRFRQSLGSSPHTLLDLRQGQRWQQLGEYNNLYTAVHMGLRYCVTSRLRASQPTRIEASRTVWVPLDKDRPAPRMLRLDDQWTSSLHRSGWRFALEPLYSLHDDRGVLFDGFLEATFCWGDSGRVYRKPWVGVIHNPPHTPEWANGGRGTNDYLLRSERFIQSRKECQGLFVLSEYHRQNLQTKVPFPVSVLRHPTEIPAQRFSPQAFLDNQRPRLVQIGVWLRNPNSLYKLRTTRLTRTRLDVGRPWEDDVRANMPSEKLDLSGVEVIPRQTDADYDDLLNRNVVFLDLVDASANNAIIECIVRHTPVLVNKHPAVVEYLGRDYPLFYRDLDEASRKAENIELIMRAHEYLRDLPKQQFTREAFIQDVVRSEVYQSLIPSGIEPFVLLAHARSGSTSLMAALAAHPQLRIVNEPFNPQRAKWGHAYLDEVHDDVSLERTLDDLFYFYTGIKHLMCQLGTAQSQRLLQRSRRRILLWRRNRLQAAVSDMVARQTHIWQGSSDKLEKARLQPLDLDFLEWHIAHQRLQLDSYRAYLDKHRMPFHELCYEDLFGDHKSMREKLTIYAELLRHLGADSADEQTLQEVCRVLDPDKSKLTKETTYQRIPNAEEIDRRLGCPETGYLFEHESQLQSA